MSITIRSLLSEEFDKAPEGQVRRLYNSNGTIKSVFSQIVDGRLHDFDAFYLLLDLIDRLDADLKENDHAQT